MNGSFDERETVAGCEFDLFRVAANLEFWKKKKKGSWSWGKGCLRERGRQWEWEWVCVGVEGGYRQAGGHTHRFPGLRVHQSGLSACGLAVCVQVYPHRYYTAISHGIWWQGLKIRLPARLCLHAHSYSSKEPLKRSPPPPSPSPILYIFLSSLHLSACSMMRSVWSLRTGHTRRARHTHSSAGRPVDRGFFC